MSFFNISIRSKIKGVRKPASALAKPLFATQPYISATLVLGSFNRIVQLPKHVDRDEWLAANVFDFFNHVTAFYGTISDFCTSRECPVMTGGAGVEYQWTDAQKRTTKVSAPQYFDFTATWIQSIINDDQHFPTKSGVPFPKEHLNTIKTIFKHLFRIFAHIYHHHYEKILHLSSEAHLNTLFAHFICFAKEFDLLDKKETEPLRELITDLEGLGLC
ncbi:Maintenance of ploidy protein mob2 [Sorochytrium milnesiophthora]